MCVSLSLMLSLSDARLSPPTQPQHWWLTQNLRSGHASSCHHQPVAQPAVSIEHVARDTP